MALLAMLKAGGAYVPLDPGYPRERLAFVLDDCRAPVLVTTAGARGFAAGCTRRASSSWRGSPRTGRPAPRTATSEAIRRPRLSPT